MTDFSCVGASIGFVHNEIYLKVIAKVYGQSSPAELIYIADTIAYQPHYSYLPLQHFVHLVLTTPLVQPQS